MISFVIQVVCVSASGLGVLDVIQSIDIKMFESEEADAQAAMLENLHTRAVRVTRRVHDVGAGMDASLQARHNPPSPGVHFWDLPPVFHRYPACISLYPRYPAVSLYLAILQQIHCIPLYPTVSSCIRTYLAVSSCI